MINQVVSSIFILVVFGFCHRHAVGAEGVTTLLDRIVKSKSIEEKRDAMGDIALLKGESRNQTLKQVILDADEEFAQESAVLLMRDGIEIEELLKNRLQTWSYGSCAVLMSVTLGRVGQPLDQTSRFIARHVLTKIISTKTVELPTYSFGAASGAMTLLGRSGFAEDVGLMQDVTKSYPNVSFFWVALAFAKNNGINAELDAKALSIMQADKLPKALRVAAASVILSNHPEADQFMQAEIDAVVKDLTALSSSKVNNEWFVTLPTMVLSKKDWGKVYVVKLLNEKEYHLKYTAMLIAANRWPELVFENVNLFDQEKIPLIALVVFKHPILRERAEKEIGRIELENELNRLISKGMNFRFALIMGNHLFN